MSINTCHTFDTRTMKLFHRHINKPLSLAMQAWKHVKSVANPNPKGGDNDDHGK